MNLYFRNLGQVINKFVSDKEKCMKEIKDDCQNMTRETWLTWIGRSGKACPSRSEG